MPKRNHISTKNAKIINQTETRAYRTLEQLQSQRLIPKLLATVAFETRHTIQPIEKYFTVRGILLEYIEGYNLADLKSADVPLKYWRGIADAATRTVVEVGKRGILNRDVKLQNFIVRKDLGVVQLDYSLCAFKDSYGSEREWRVATECQDEVGAVTVTMRRKIRENGEPCL